MKEKMTEFRSGFVAILGRPNVGKSTLVNALLRQKIAAVSPKPQTTRRRQLGILTDESSQIVFVDTPGLHEARHKLGEFLNQEAREALEHVDAALFLVDASVEPTEEDRSVAALLSHLPGRVPRFLALNKIDLLDSLQLIARTEDYSKLLPGAEVRRVSARQGTGLEELHSALVGVLPERPPEYPEDQVTDSYERDIASDLIREAALLKLRDEVPHGIAVRIDEFTERENGMAYIAATLFVERESQKGIVIGDGGKMLKAIGTAARQEIESMGGRPVYLELRVKVLKEWRKDENALLRFGYKIKGKKKARKS
jgi:GTP-binding protein Era